MIDLSTKHEFDLLLACVLGEAESEPLFGKLAVACVVRNRVLDPRWPNNYKDVLLQRKQFSCFLPEFYADNIPDMFTRRYNQSWWREAKFAAFGVYYNWIQDISNGANHYYSVSIDPPSWTRDQHPVLYAGDHIFFKL